MNAVTELLANMNSGEDDSKTRGLLEVVEDENNCEKKHDAGQQVAALNSLCCNLNRPTALFSSGENEVLISDILKVIANFDVLKADSWKRWSLSEIQTALDIMFGLAGVSARGCSVEDCGRYAQFHENWRGLVENVPVVQKLINGEDINTFSVNMETEKFDAATVAAMRELCKQLKRPVALFSPTAVPSTSDIMPIIAHLDVSVEDSWTRWTLSDIQLALNIMFGLTGVSARECSMEECVRFAEFQSNVSGLVEHVPVAQQLLDGEDINTSVNMETEGVDAATVAAVRELCKQLKRPVSLFSARPAPSISDILPIIAHLDVSVEDSWTRWTLSDIQLSLNIMHGLVAVSGIDCPLEEVLRFSDFQGNWSRLVEHVPALETLHALGDSR